MHGHLIAIRSIVIQWTVSRFKHHLWQDHNRMSIKTSWHLSEIHHMIALDVYSKLDINYPNIYCHPNKVQCTTLNYLLTFADNGSSCHRLLNDCAKCFSISLDLCGRFCQLLGSELSPFSVSGLIIWSSIQAISTCSSFFCIHFSLLLFDFINLLLGNKSLFKATFKS